MIETFAFFDTDGHEIADLRATYAQPLKDSETDTVQDRLVNAFVAGCTLSVVQHNESSALLWQSVASLKETFSGATLTRENVIETLKKNGGTYRQLPLARQIIPELES